MKVIFSIIFLSSMALCQTVVPVMGTTFNGGGIGNCGAATGYTNAGTITVSAQSSLSADITNALVVFGGDSHLATVGNGGLSQSNGTDVVFCTKNDGTGTIIPFLGPVPNTYNATTGLGKWIFQGATISKTLSKKFYVYVGKASATDLSCGPSGSNNCGSTLLSNYLGVIEYGSASVIDVTDWTLINTTVNNTVSAIGGVIFGAGNFGGAHSLDAGGHMNPTSAFTIEAWIDEANISNIQFMLSNTSNLSTGGFEFYIFSSGLTCGMGGSGTTSEYRFTSGLSTGTWIHATCRWNGSNGTVTANWSMFLNAVSQALGVVAAGSTGYTTSSTNANYGQQPGGNFKLGSFLGETRMYNGSLSNDTILWDYTNSGNPGSTYSVTFP